LPILFFILQKGAYGNIRDKAAVLRGQFRALTVWSAGSFAPRNLRKELKIRPKGRREKALRPLAWEKESFPKKESVEKLFSLLGAFHQKMNDV